MRILRGLHLQEKPDYILGFKQIFSFSGHLLSFGQTKESKLGAVAVSSGEMGVCL